jgi:polyisoprenoid-binding protein YceI
MKFSSLFLVASLAVAGCSKKEEPKATTNTEAKGSTQPATETPADKPAETPAAPAEDPNADSIVAYAMHKQPKPEDPVKVKFSNFTVKAAKFDPQNLEGGTATIELDMSSISSGSEKRDGHLKTGDYFDVAKFATATIDVSNVKKTGEKTYSADAKVSFRDTEKTYPVTFEVLQTKEEAVQIKGVHEFDRTDFGIGKDPSDENEGAAASVKIEVQLWLKNV